MEKHRKYKKILGLALAGLGAILSNNAVAEMQLSTKGGLQVCDPSNPCYWFSLNGRMDLDEILFSGTYRDRQNNFPSSANLRRAVVDFNGGVGDCLTYNLALDFGRSQRVDQGLSIINPEGAEQEAYLVNPQGIRVSHGHTLIQEAWLGYTGLWDCSRLRIGQFTPISTMDFYANDDTCNNQMFLESALATMTFNVPSYIDTDSRMMKGLGIMLDTQWFDCFTVAATIYQPPVGPDLNYNDPRRSDRLGEALRVTYSPLHDCDQVFHIGAMGRYQSLNHTDSSRTLSNDISENINQPGVRSDAIRNNLFFTPPEVIPRNYVGQHRKVNGLWGSDPNLINAGLLRAKSYAHVAGEVLATCGPLTFQGEYHHVTVHRKPDSFRLLSENDDGDLEDTLYQRNGNLKFHGWHAQAGYVLTGESRCYNFASGTLGGIKPCSPWGAWEVVARYSYVTLFDKDVYGGAGHNATVGLNWFVNDNVRLAFNYIRVNINPTNTALAPSGAAIVNAVNQAGVQPAPGQAGPKRHLDTFAARLQVVF